MPSSFTASAATTPANARTEPTDKSMPPVMMTQVAPIPKSAIDVTCRAIVMALLTLKKALLVAENTMASTTRLPSAANFWMMSFCLSLSEGVLTGSGDFDMSYLIAPCGYSRRHSA